MPHEKISTNFIVADISSGMHDNVLMAKFELLAGLRSLFSTINRRENNWLIKENEPETTAHSAS